MVSLVIGRWLPCAAFMALLGVPCAAAAQEPGVPSHVHELIQEVMTVVDQVKHDPRAARADEADASKKADPRCEAGVVPFTRTVVALLWKGLPIVDEDDDGESHRTPYLIQVKPKHRGGQLRWTVRF